jgi:hypothetical protein
VARFSLSVLCEGVVVDKVFQVFVSSTYEDLIEERRQVREALVKAGYMPAGMEFFPAVDEQQLKYIKRVIDRSDYYIVIVGGRYGSVARDNLSFTEKEYNYALKKKIPVLAFLPADPDKIEVGKADTRSSQAKKLKAFRDRLSKTVRMIDHWTDAKDLSKNVVIAVGNQVNLTPGVGWVRGDQTFDPKLLQEMEGVRIENEALKRRLEQFESAPGNAFIYGGFGRRSLLRSEDHSEARIRAQVTMANYGKGAGFIQHIEVGKGNLDEGLPPTPHYSGKFEILDFYFPEMKMSDVRATRAWIEIPGDGRHVVFQRVWYTDQSTNSLNFSGSIYRLEAVSEGDHTRIIDEPILGGSEYWSWGKVA